MNNIQQVKDGSERAPEIGRTDKHAHVGLGRRTENRNKKATKQLLSHKRLRRRNQGHK